MDWQLIVNVGGTACLGIAGWFIQRVMSNQSDTANALTAFRIEVAKEYVTHADLREIRDMLVRIEARVNARADNSNGR